MQAWNDYTIAPEPLFASMRERNVVFFLVFMGVLSLTYGFFYLIDFLPQTPGTSNAASAIVQTKTGTTTVATLTASTTPTSVTVHTIDPYPKRIIFDTLDHREIAILNPDTRSIVSLDTALLSGAVRHPDSADFDHQGTIFLFGHSSYLPTVINKNFQAFNGIQKLAWGDTIRLQSADTEYVYRVDRVYQATASSTEVKIETGKPKLTLATCNSFGSKDDRFVVEATLVDQHKLAS